jgi:hypothetical protein
MSDNVHMPSSKPLSAMPTPTSVIPSSGIIITRPEKRGRPMVAIAQPNERTGVVTIDYGQNSGYSRGAVAPNKLAEVYLVPEERQIPPFDVTGQSSSAKTQNEQFAAAHQDTLPGLESGKFQVLGDSGVIGNSFMLAMQRMPEMARALAQASEPLDSTAPRTVADAEGQLARVGFRDLPGLFEKARTPETEHLLKDVMKAALFRGPDPRSANSAIITAIAVQTNKGTWLTVLPNVGTGTTQKGQPTYTSSGPLIPSEDESSGTVFVEVEHLSQLEGGTLGKLAQVFATPRDINAPPHMDPKVGALLTSESRTDYI